MRTFCNIGNIFPYIIGRLYYVVLISSRHREAPLEVANTLRGAVLSSTSCAVVLVAHQRSDILDAAIRDDDDVTGVELGVQDSSVDIPGAV